jgi:membrane protein insertase Oxa1/YidC/SpoIIIJ
VVGEETLNVSQMVKDLDFIPDVTLFGYDLGVTRWDAFGKPYWWLIFIPLLNLGLMYLSQFLTKKLQYQSTLQEQANGQMNSMRIMMLVMPLMTMFITFKFAAAIGIYWIFRTLLSMLQQFILSKIFKMPKYSDEDLKRIEKEMKDAKKNQQKRPDIVYEGGEGKGYKSLHHIDDDE